MGRARAEGERGLREQAGASWAEVWAVRGERSELGPRDAAGPRKGKGRAGLLGWVLERERWAAGFGWVLGFWSSFPLLFLIYFYNKQTKFDFKYKFEFKPHSNN